MASSLPQKSGACKGKRWEKVDRHQYLYRYAPAGTYYLRGRFGGEPVRLALQTDDFATAVERLDVQRARLRAEQRAGWKGAMPTLHDALAAVEALIEADPSTKEGTKQNYRETLARMKPGAAYAVPSLPLDRITVKEMAEWWQHVAVQRSVSKKVKLGYAPRQANQMLMFVRRAIKHARESLPHIGDPTSKLKRVKVPRTRHELPTITEFYAVVASIRGQKKAFSEEAADYVEFMAYSGARPKEIAEIEWRDVKKESIEIWGGADRTKNGDMRQVPIVPPMADLLRRMGRDLHPTGKVFTMKKPRGALTSACQNLKLRHQHIYALRHLFATTCLEAGVDVPTFAGWLGHKDGGALAMRTYVQNRNEHRDAMAAKVTFA